MEESNISPPTPEGGACSHDKTCIRTLTAVLGCETTAEFCIECGKQLSQPKTEC